MFCTWLVAYCNVKDFNIIDLIGIPYRKPYIEMFEDIREGIIGGDFSVEAISEFFESTSERLFRDCKDCKNGTQEIRSAASSIRKGSKKQIFNI